jgi:hypothetical protein
MGERVDGEIFACFHQNQWPVDAPCVAWRGYRADSQRLGGSEVHVVEIGKLAREVSNGGGYFQALNVRPGFFLCFCLL